MKHRGALKNAIRALLNRRLVHYEGSQLFNGPGRRWLAGRCFHGWITKSGNSAARHLAIGDSHSLAPCGSPLSATDHWLRRKRGHNVAVTALARKLIVVISHLLTAHQPYRYAALTRSRTKLRTVRPNRRRAPAGRLTEPRPSPAARIVALPRVGGLHYRYAWQEAA